MSATELGMDSPPDTSLQEKKVASVNVAPMQAPLLPMFGGRGKVFYPDPAANAKKALNAVEKGKARAVEPGSRTRGGVSEKENSSKVTTGGRRSSKASPANVAPMSRRATSAVVGGGKPMARVGVKSAPLPTATSTMNVTTSRARPATKPVTAPPAPGAGPRRVLITSADAPPIVKGRRG